MMDYNTDTGLRISSSMANKTAYISQFKGPRAIQIDYAHFTILPLSCYNTVDTWFTFVFFPVSIQGRSCDCDRRSWSLDTQNTKIQFMWQILYHITLH